MSFLKFHQQTDGNGRGDVHWSRASRDGAPFRGDKIPLLRDEEYENLSERVYDANVETFDTSDQEQKDKLKQVLDASANGWYKVLCMERKWLKLDDGGVKMCVYVEWVEPYQEISPSKLRNL
jgi:hypothetical protein|tara:strand:- start:4826 stop:5191 length:366 start_codon:yes stop_codon:yes gene_type:complete